MSKLGKTIVWAIVAVVILGGIAWWSSMQQTGPAGTGAPAQTSSGSRLQDTSNAALSSDLAGVDNQMKAMNTDSANVNQSLNDQPVQQDNL